MIVVDDSSPTPPYEQIRAQIANEILVGALAKGERLPTVRQLAADLRLAPGTVARAYSILESDGLVETRRGAGTRVSAGPETFPDVGESAVEFVRAARSRGLNVEQAVLSVRAAWGKPS